MNCNELQCVLIDGLLPADHSWCHRPAAAGTTPLPFYAWHGTL